MNAEKIKRILDVAWDSYTNRVATGLNQPENEKMMQLQLAIILQTILPIFEYSPRESFKLLLEEPVELPRTQRKRIIDILIVHTLGEVATCYPIELKCFRLYARGKDTKRGGQNLGMYDYWEDIENLEQYSLLPNYGFGTHFAITDDPYYVTGIHNGRQVQVYSTALHRNGVTGLLQQEIKHRPGTILLEGHHSTDRWMALGGFHFLRQDNISLISKSE